MIRNPIRKLLARMVRRPTEPSRGAVVASTGPLMVDSFPVMVDAFTVEFS